MIFLEDDSDKSDDSRFEWYSYTWNNKVPEYKFEGNDSDLDNSIDEARRKDKLKKKKTKPTTIRCSSDLTGNVYLKEDDVNSISINILVVEELKEK
ncbi:hypothetical protein F8M41_023119 [Gigaspora margarita]|uniref:Uncharacterized protein n=1 Tax=Gigaspora margarita TaxID=4874 RepID=A0A8H4ADW2_GIGMA|nr:hypothetical protein F8M41_023119 [Gigaspora margarita]